MSGQENAGIGFNLFQITHSKMKPSVGVSPIKLDGAQIRSNRRPCPSTAGVGLTKSDLRLNVCGLGERSSFEVWKSLVELLQLQIIKPQKQVWNK